MALRGINVIEFAGLAPGPFCGKILRDLGARVIRIDRIGVGSLVPDTLAHGKKSIAIDLKQKGGIELIKTLSLKSDVLIEPFRKGVMEKLGIGPEVLCSLNKKLIYARLTGYGQTGELAAKGGHDINYLGYSGILSRIGRDGEKPLAPLNLVADFAGGGLMCAMAIMTALYERDTYSKLGKVLDCTMVEGAAYTSSWIYSTQNTPMVWNAFNDKKRGTNLLDGGYAAYDTYETKDGKYMAIGSLEPQFLKNALKGLGLKMGDVNKETLEKTFKSKTREEWDNIFKTLDACVTPVLELEEAPLHKHNIERKAFVKLQDGTIIPKMNWLNELGTQSNDYELPATGQHTIEILTEYGYSQENIKTLLDDETIAQSEVKAKL